jgi:hypothetical protein
MTFASNFANIYQPARIARFLGERDSFLSIIFKRIFGTDRAAISVRSTWIYSSELFLAKLQRTSYWSLYAQELNFFSVPIDQKVTENLISEKDLQKK